MLMGTGGNLAGLVEKEQHWYLSRDGGQTWKQISLPDGRVPSIWVASTWCPRRASTTMGSSSRTSGTAGSGSAAPERRRRSAPTWSEPNRVAAAVNLTGASTRCGASSGFTAPHPSGPIGDVFYWRVDRRAAPAKGSSERPEPGGSPSRSIGRGGVRRKRRHAPRTRTQSRLVRRPLVV